MATPGVGEFASAMQGGMDAALNEQRRQELLQSVLARFNGQGQGPLSFNFASPRQQAFQQNPIAGQPPIIPTDLVTQDTAAAANATAPDLSQPIPSTPPALLTQQQMAAAPTEEMMQQAAPSWGQKVANFFAPPSPEGGVGPAPSMSAAPGPEEDQGPGLPQMDDVNAWRQGWQQAAATHQNLAYTDLRRQGFDDQEIFAILGGWRDLPPSVIEKLSRAGNVSVPQYATGTETFDAKREASMAGLVAQHGLRAADPVLAQKFGDPNYYQQAMNQNATAGEFAPSKLGGRAGGGKTGDLVAGEYSKRANETKDFMGRVVRPKEHDLWTSLAEARSRFLAGAAFTERDKELLKTHPELRSPWTPAERQFAAPDSASGKKKSDEDPYSEALAPSTEEAAEPGNPPDEGGEYLSNVAPGDAPEPVRKAWAGLTPGERKLLAEAAAGSGWERTLQDQEAKDILSRRKNGKKAGR